VEVVLVAILVASAVVAFAVGRWWTVFVPVAALGVFYAGLNAGWWGSGVGDGWQFAMALVIGVGIVAAALGVAAHRLVRRRAERPVSSQGRG
jgi:hypothetical protein